MKTLTCQRGYLMLICVYLIMVIGFLGLVIAWMVVSTETGLLDYHLGEKDFFITEAGLEQASRYLLSNNVDCTSITGNSDLTNASFGAGTFTVTGTSYMASTTLSSAITAASSTIPVSSTTGLAAQGLITIKNEYLSYSGISGNNLTNVVRGLFGTTAASASSSTTVSQNECLLTATAGIPSTASPKVVKTLTKAIPLGGGWAVGAPASSKQTYASLTGSLWSYAGFGSGGSTSFGVSLDSSTDGWAVGSSGQFYHWNGTSWSLTTVSPAVTYNGVYCVSSNVCFAAGQNSGGKTTLQNWNGSTWTNTALSTAPNLTAVNCDSSSDCWAVGSASPFYHWNGSNWTAVTVNLHGTPFQGVYCTSPSNCWAVGNNNTLAFYNGTSWSDYATTLRAVQYNDVFCNSSSDCWTVGKASGSQDVIAHWNGTSWTQTSSTPSPAANLNGVSCSNSNNCWAVGGSTAGNNPTFVQWNGTTWANVAGSGMPSNAILYSVSLTKGTIGIPGNSAMRNQILP